MDYYNRVSGRSFDNINLNSLFKLTDLDPRVQRHVQRVYTTLACALAVSTLGVLANIFLDVGGFLTTMTALGSLIALMVIPASQQNLNKRYAALAGFAFSQGASLGPLVNVALFVHPAVLVTALLGTTTIFGCFSAAALLTKRRSMLFLGGWLSSAMLGFLAMRLGSALFGGAALAFELELYLGLVVFAGYVLFDTQLIVERASAGDMDHIKHTLDLFVDFMALLARVLIIVLRNQERRESGDKRRRRH